MKSYSLQEALTSKTIKFLEEIDSFEGFQFDGIRSFSDLRKEVKLVITDREPFLESIKKEKEQLDKKFDDIQNKMGQIRGKDENEFARLKESVKKIRRERESLSEEYEEYQSKGEILLGLYSHFYPRLNIKSPTVVLFKDAIEQSSILKKWPGTEEYLYGYVYIHEMFHAYFDSMSFDKNPSKNIEETFAELGALTFSEILSGCNSPFNKFCQDCVFIKSVKYPQYFAGYLLYNKEFHNYDTNEKRVCAISCYRMKSGRINLPCNFDSDRALTCNLPNEQDVFKCVETILNTNWY